MSNNPEKASLAVPAKLRRPSISQEILRIEELLKSDPSVLSTNEFHTLCLKYKVKDLIKEKKVIVCYSDEEPVEVFQRIVDNKILSAPAFDKAEKKYIGFVDTRDIVQYVVFKVEEEQKAADTNSLKPPRADLRSIFDTATRMHKDAMSGITLNYLARRNRFVPISPDESLLKLAHLLSIQGVHRVPVVGDNSDEIIDIISQSTLASFLYEHRDEVQGALSVPIAEAKIGTSPVKTVRESDSALSVFKQMAKHNLSGLAVVDSESGRFVGNTSGSDLKLYIQDPSKNTAMLNQPIMDFLAAIRQADVTTTKSPTISVRPDSAVSLALGKMHATRVHRVFVADDSSGFKPQSVISVGDMLVYLLNKDNANKIVVN